MWYLTTFASDSNNDFNKYLMKITQISLIQKSLHNEMERKLLVIFSFDGELSLKAGQIYSQNYE